ncbi:uncharacterized protein METZ01_LOCUS108628 [marine metagenome]|uniref:Uncharacterized protein n=1 Tax=marine metagenome TaxID=408172 RepID=A0A381WTG1_9ZZZZ
MIFLELLSSEPLPVLYCTSVNAILEDRQMEIDPRVL